MSLSSLLRQKITIENPSGKRDKQGAELFVGGVKPVRCRFQKTDRVMVTPQNTREPIDAIVFVGPRDVIQKSARVVYFADKYRIMKLEPIPGKNGKTHHYEMMLQLWSYKAATP